jgi:hypothetical protein
MLIALLQEQRLRERAPVLHYTYIACLYVRQLIPTDIAKSMLKHLNGEREKKMVLR